MKWICSKNSVSEKKTDKAEQLVGTTSRKNILTILRTTDAASSVETIFDIYLEMIVSTRNIFQDYAVLRLRVIF